MIKNPIRRVIDNLQRELEDLAIIILSTPTSTKRNELCDAQIHMIAAVEQLAKHGAEPAGYAHEPRA